MYRKTVLDNGLRVLTAEMPHTPQHLHVRFGGRGFAL